jgi:phenylacetic acid degradation operon negative regulatory protein
VIASTLLGMHPPRLPSRILVRSGELFGISEGTTRTAISRMVGAGELEAEDGAYRLAGPLLERQARQDASREARRLRWRGDWELAVVRPDRRTAAARSALRTAAGRLRLAELRDGVWTRPANLDPDRQSDDRAVVDGQSERFTARPSGDPAALAAALWDLDGWASRSRDLSAAMARAAGPLDEGDLSRLGDAFVLAASVLRHLLADPLLPDELLPDDWPGSSFRADEQLFDRTFTAAWRAWFRDQRALP